MSADKAQSNVKRRMTMCDSQKRTTLNEFLVKATGNIQKHMLKKLRDRTFEQQYMRFKNMEQADQIEKVAMSIASKKNRHAMELQGSGAYYERLYLKHGH